ncbi:Glutathione S-transferase omega-1 [Paramyrothecium foliicola]|nr:Glutathione S-transferase omega-1 [Paramyrothecium foliicola]
MAASPELILYTNHACPWAHRVHIALNELNLPFKEEIVDLSTPRTEEYLKINPRGLVPSLSYDGQILTESGIVSQFLTDAHPSHLVPPSDSKEGALRRAKIGFFVDTYISKVQTPGFKIFSAKSDAEAEEIARAQVAAIVKEIEPLLEDAAPFFGGSKTLTLAEVLVGSFIVRFYAQAKSGLLFGTVIPDLAKQAPNFSKWAEAVIVHPSVNDIFHEEDWVQRYKARIAKAREA